MSYPEEQQITRELAVSTSQWEMLPKAHNCQRQEGPQASLQALPWPAVLWRDSPRHQYLKANSIPY